MKVTKGEAHGCYHYWTVAVDPGELQVESGKRLPYGTWIGTIRSDRAPTLAAVWSPAAYKPRGYRKAALDLLRVAHEAMRKEGWPRVLELAT